MFYIYVVRAILWVGRVNGNALYFSDVRAIVRQAGLGGNVSGSGHRFSSYLCYIYVDGVCNVGALSVNFLLVTSYQHICGDVIC